MLTEAKTLSEEKPFRYKVVNGGEIVVYPSDPSGVHQDRDALVITPFVVDLVKRSLSPTEFRAVGASRDRPPANSLGAALKAEGCSPQHLSYLVALLVSQGSCEYRKDGRAIFVRGIAK